MSSPLIDARALRAALRGSVPPVLLHVPWDLVHGARRDLFAEGHIPGAAFIDLGADLADPVRPGGTQGRHPLPEPERFAAAMRAAGVSAARPVVAYDDTGGLAAARAWWLLRHYGHGSVSVLDGGLAGWAASGGAIVAGRSAVAAPGDFAAGPGAMPVIDADQAAELARASVLLDARAAERFSGAAEPVDPVAGHIPGARSRPTTQNLRADGGFAPPHALAAAFAEVGATPGAEIGVYCGSGVTACHQLLALEVAGITGAALYPGSWSDWVSDPSRPVARS